MSKLYIEAEGCIRRRLEIEKVKRYCELNDYKIVNNIDEADKIIFGTCAFKKEEEEYCLSRIKQLSKKKEVIIMGCLPDIAKDTFKKDFSEIKSVSPKNLSDIELYIGKGEVRLDDIPDKHTLSNSFANTTLSTACLKFYKLITSPYKYLIFNKVKNYLANKINISNYYYLNTSSGCLGKCSYCRIKSAIGDVRSKSIEENIQDLLTGLNHGFRDYKVIGDDVGAYGIDKGNNLPNLLKSLFAISDEWMNQERNKIKSSQQINFYIDELHPKWLIIYKNEFLELALLRYIKSILIPIQSGNDRVLRLMNREHNIKAVTDILKKLKVINPDIELHTQVIVGFPTETDNEFQHTLKIINDIKFNSVILFPFDLKKGTPAEKLTPRLPEEIKAKRITYARKYLKKNGINTYLNCSNLKI